MQDFSNPNAELKVSVMSSLRALKELLECPAVMQNRELVDTIGMMVETLYSLEDIQTEELAKELAKSIASESKHDLRRTRLVEADSATEFTNRGTQQAAIEEFAPLIPRQYSPDELARFARRLK